MFIMPHSCCVPECTSMGNQSGDQPVSKFVTFHQFTKDKALRKKWIHAIRRDEGKHFVITHHTTICSRHFTDDCLVWTGFAKKRRTLKSNSVPSLFPWNDWGKQLLTPRRLLQRHVCPQLITSAPLTCTLSTLTPSSGSSNKENIERLDNTDTTLDAANCPQERGVICSNFARLQSMLDVLQKQNESLQKQNESLQKQNESSQKQNDSLQKQNAMLNANLLLLNESISGLKKKTFCLENFICSDKDIDFDSERFQILCTLVEGGENGCDVEWYNPQKKIYKEVGMEDGIR